MSTELRCDACGGVCVVRVVDRWPNGETKEIEWRCENPDCKGPWAHAWNLDCGTLDLGIVRDSVLEDKFEYEIWSEDKIC